MNNPIDDCIARSLARDPLREVEEITGRPYTDLSNTALGLAMVHDVAEQRKSILSLSQDAYYAMPFDRFLDVVPRLVFPY